MWRQGAEVGHCGASHSDVVWWRTYNNSYSCNNIIMTTDLFFFSIIFFKLHQKLNFVLHLSKADFPRWTCPHPSSQACASLLSLLNASMIAWGIFYLHSDRSAWSLKFILYFLDYYGNLLATVSRDVCHSPTSLKLNCHRNIKRFADGLTFVTFTFYVLGSTLFPVIVLAAITCVCHVQSDEHNRVSNLKWLCKWLYEKKHLPFYN